VGKDLSLTASLFGRDVSMGKALGGVGKQAKSATQTLESMGRKATVVFGAIAAAALMAGKAAAEDAKSQTILAGTLQNSAHATKQQVAAVEAYISKTSLAVGIADDEMRPAFARLARSTKDTVKAQSLMNTALDITAQTSIPLADVTNALGKAYNGNFKGLNKLGLGISATTLKSKDFNKIMAEVTKTVNGFAKKEANTAEGKMRRLKIATNELKESFGYMLLPYLEKTSDVFAKMLPFIERNKTTIGKIIVVIAGLAAAVIAANVALKVFQALQTVKMFAAMIARWAGYTVAVEAAGTATTVAGAEIATAGAAAQVAWAPFLLTIAAIAAAFVGIKLVTDKLIVNREKLLTKGDKNLNSDLKNLYGITPDRLSALNKPSEIRSMPRHAKGGIVTRAHIGMIGESGPEAIIPLNKAGMFGGVTIINNIQGSVVTEKEIAVRVRNDMAQLLRRKGLSTAILGV
jgi:hypothetical protein